MLETILSIIPAAASGVTAFVGAIIGIRIQNAKMEMRIEAAEKRLTKTEHTLYGNAREGLKSTVERHDYTISTLCSDINKLSLGRNG
jgi:hypothetical protein